MRLGFDWTHENTKVEKQFNIIHRRMTRAALKVEVFTVNEAVEQEVGAMKFTEMLAIGQLKLLWKLSNDHGTLHRALLAVA